MNAPLPADLQPPERRAHKAAIVASWLYFDRFSPFFLAGGTTAAFWDTLNPGEQENCRDLLRDLEGAPEEPR